ncbi:DUF4254 domain-containing protein [Mycobacterium scrofulaceum]|uniref:Uncharacterized protein n=1 Tax=Mycobacterium scrofulaceum TaxID=1783 RepID=A0A1X0K5L9_MYCSC|nr:DUF4254 domain-containing protein [Mycobacterium scrofulaceum]ORB70452.1 hypothetical protein BST44_23485 [Mycobacterium scrofulaceum]
MPALRAMAELFTAPLTLICPRVVFDLCFREVSDRHVDTTGLPLTGPHPLPGSLRRAPDYETLAAAIGAVDVFIDTLAWNALSSTVIRPLVQRLAPRTTIGFPTEYGYDFVVPQADLHAADQMFQLARLFDPALRIESYAQALPIPSSVRELARKIRDEVPAGKKVLVVHADTDWAQKRWPAGRFIDLLDRFLSRHRHFVAWVVGMGHEELNVGRAGDRVFPHLGLPLDLAMALVGTGDLFVGIDSSMLHAADLARVPGVGLFGATRAATWGFRFGPHRHVEMASMADITVAEVLGALEDLTEEHVGVPAPPQRRNHAAVQPDSPRVAVLAAVAQFVDLARSWHREQPAADGAGIGAKALRLHALNFGLWHQEDAVRRDGVSDREVAGGKRAIDALNASRNAAVEDIDAALLDRLVPNASAPLHTETPATIVDRLSVLALRIVHTNRSGADGERLATLEEQYADLVDGLDRFLSRVVDGLVRFQVYRQFKTPEERSSCALSDDRDQ